MSRKLPGGLIEEICLYYQETEVPGAFALWSGLFAVSACMGRNCFIDQGHFTVYPNLYVVLTAGSGVCRKSTAINIVSDLVDRVDPPITILSQRITPEELIGTLSKRSNQENIIVEESVGYFIADEVSTLIDKTTGMAALIPILTKLYDGKNFDYSTRSHGKEFVKNPCLGILGGSTLEWIKESFPAHAIGGGFTARIVFVFRSQREREIPWPRKSKENADRFDRIAVDLNQIAKLRGAFGVTEDAIELYSDEYRNFLKEPIASNPLTTRYAERRHVTLLKVATILSASRSDDREITKEDIWRASQILRGAESGREHIMRKIVSEPCGDLCEQIMSLIITRGTISRADLLYETRHKITHKELDVILEGIVESGHVKKTIKDSKLIYVYEVKRNEPSC